MWFLWIVIGLLIGLGGAFLYWKKKLEPTYNAAIEGQENCASKLAKVYGLLDTTHNAIWGPVGMHPGIAEAHMNKVWEWAGLPQNGFPDK